MSKKLLALTGLALCVSAPASAATVLDPVRDFLPSFEGPRSADLDVTSFSATYNPGTMNFMLGAVLAGTIDPSQAGLYAIGVNTGTGRIAPFASIGHPDVTFNQVVVVQKSGTGSVGPTPLAPGSVSVFGNQFTATVPLSLLPSTGFAPESYAFNLWPRTGLGSNAQISDFAPNNALLTAGAIPEPSTWAMMLFGFGFVGGAIRAAKRRQKLTVSYA